MHKFFTFLLLFSIPVAAAAEDLALSKLFAGQDVDGTIVIASLNTGKTFTHNDSRARRQFSPASTFKIMNTLIAIEEKAVSGKSDVFKWNGHVYDIPNWNHDQTLESAFKVSCVWCYQELARRIGIGKYRKYLRKSEYGKLQDSFDVTTFWLDGSLQISAFEQVNFLNRLYRRTLPFQTVAYETLGQIMLVDQTPAFSLWAKTGWTAKVGWYVGYVETPEDVWFFALNMEIRNKKDLALRQKLAHEALQIKGINVR